MLSIKRTTFGIGFLVTFKTRRKTRLLLVSSRFSTYSKKYGRRSQAGVFVFHAFPFSYISV